jgi:hypothetical protein
MEFKTILYILIGLSWFIFNNYKKIVAENKKRNFNPTPPLQPGERKIYQATEANEAKPIPAIPPIAEHRSKKTYRSIDKKREVVKSDAKTLYESTRQKNKAERALSIKPERIKSYQEETIQTPVAVRTSVINVPQTLRKKNKLTINIKDKKQLQQAFILGEILNKPLYNL